MKAFQCLIITQDVVLVTILKFTLKEYGFNFEVVSSIDALGKISFESLTVGWLIDLDGIQRKVEDIMAQLKRFSLETKVVFLSSQFTRELAEACLKEGAISLLVKPLIAPKLAQAINSFFGEAEPLKPENPVSTDQETREQETSPPVGEENFLQKIEFHCPVCSWVFVGNEFKMETFRVVKTDTDFCRIGPPNLIPELYAIAVCRKCAFAHYVEKFGNLKFTDDRRAKFLLPFKIEERKRISLNLEYGKKRDLLRGTKSYDLAIHSANEFEVTEPLRLSAEFSLKASWLARKMGNAAQEKVAQTAAVKKFVKLYKPYLSENGNFPSQERITEKLGKDVPPLAEKTIIETCFLIADLSRRLGNSKQADLYFQEVLRIPYLSNFSSLLKHIHDAGKLFVEV